MSVIMEMIMRGNKKSDGRKRMKKREITRNQSTEE